MLQTISNIGFSLYINIKTLRLQIQGLQITRIIRIVLKNSLYHIKRLSITSEIKVFKLGL